MEKQDEEDEKLRGMYGNNIDEANNLKKDITKAIRQYRKDGEDPNKYFNYTYYAVRCNDLTLIELGDFLFELKKGIKNYKNNYIDYSDPDARREYEIKLNNDL